MTGRTSARSGVTDRTRRWPTLPAQLSTSDTSWRLFARCSNIDTDAFFPPDNSEPKGPRLRRERIAKQICSECPVLLRCGAHALAAPEQYGVWGGMSELERRRVKGRSAASRCPPGSTAPSQMRAAQQTTKNPTSAIAFFTVSGMVPCTGSSSLATGSTCFIANSRARSRIATRSSVRYRGESVRGCDGR